MVAGWSTLFCTAPGAVVSTSNHCVSMRPSVVDSRAICTPFSAKNCLSLGHVRGRVFRHYQPPPLANALHANLFGLIITINGVPAMADDRDSSWRLQVFSEWGTGLLQPRYPNPLVLATSPRTSIQIIIAGVNEHAHHRLQTNHNPGSTRTSAKRQITPAKNCVQCAFDAALENGVKETVVKIACDMRVIAAPYAASG